MEIRNNLAHLRLKRGLGAAQLASEVGVSRQTIYAIEAGSYVPNTAVSLKLARILESTVEEIFRMEANDDTAVEIAEAAVLGDPDAMPPGQPLRLCLANGRLVAVPPDPGNWGLSPTDATLLAPIHGGKHHINARVEILGHSWNNPTRILIAGCDPSASIFAHSLERQGCELVISYHNSSRSLELLQQKLVHVAGMHLLDEATGETDLLPITRMFPRNSVAVFSYAMWQEGLVVARGNPKSITGIRDLSRKGIKIANREPGSGCRRLLDDLLAKHGISSADISGYEQISLGHLPAARLVASGEADCCIGLQAGARALGLDFLPLRRKPYHLVMARKQLDLPPIQTMLETLGRASFRREMEASTGYDMHHAGDRII